MDLYNKLSTLSTIPVKTLTQLGNYVNLIESHDIVTQLLEGKSVVSLEILEGTLNLTLDNTTDTIKYKFIPNDNFIKLVTDSYIKRESKLVEAVSDKLKETLVNTYKDLI